MGVTRKLTGRHQLTKSASIALGMVASFIAFFGSYVACQSRLRSAVSSNQGSRRIRRPPSLLIHRLIGSTFCHIVD
jgi:hypothetical protein